ncbi:MAG: trypsin-like peptidase domain-containing protein [Clostridiales bacterium]|nr:trypsin-like peptidase domain-containing protein [Clostridiales bacterium]
MKYFCIWPMSGRKNKYMKFYLKNLICLCLTASCGEFSVTVYAQEHRPLIQTTTFQDQYEGMVCYDGTVLHALEKADIKRAYENVKAGIVKISTGNFYGSGVIWEMNEKEIIIISNKHLLENWQEDGCITFWNGITSGGRIVKLSSLYDLGFLKVDIKDLAYEDLISLKEVKKDETAYAGLKAGDAVFHVGSADGAGENMYEGTVASPFWYIKEFDSYMLYGFGFGKPGMSGGGTFDAYGNFVGMLTGGTDTDETASLPITSILEEYSSL